MTQIFGAETTTEDVLAGVDLTGRRILVTGASAGLGVETVRALKAHGAEVIGAARDLAKAKRALAAVGVETQLLDLDLASLASCRKAADELLKEGKKFDVVIANAGVMACPKGKTADGFETQFGTNHLGHFVFINRIAPLFSDPARVVMLASRGHQNADVNLDDPNFETTHYTPFAAYGRSKTANVLYAVALDKRLRARGVRAASVHPGVIQTELSRHMTEADMEKMRASRGIANWIYKSIPQGAATSVWAAIVAPAEEVGGKYCFDCGVSRVSETELDAVRPYAVDPARAEALWLKSEAMVGEKFPFS